MNSRTQLAFTLYMTFFGIVLGYAVVSVLMAIAMPAFYGSYPVTLQERADFIKLEEAAMSFNRYSDALFIIILALYTIVVGFMMKVLNPLWSLKALKSKVGIVKAIVVFGVLTVGIGFVTYHLEEFYNVSGGIEPARGIMIALLFALMWLIGGEGGWAGNLEGFGFGERDNRDMKATFLYGAACGIVVAGLGVIYQWAFANYFLLVSEALDGTAETSYKGFQLLTKGIVSLAAFSFATFGASVFALSPVSVLRKERNAALRLPIVLILVTVVTFAVSYRNADAKYDLGARSLNEAASLDTNELPPRTVVLFATEPLVDEWELKAAYFRMMDSGDFVASEENVEKLQDYMDSRKELSVYTYAAEDAQVNSRFLLWQPQKGRELMGRYMEGMLLTRFKLLRQVEMGQINREMEGYLRKFMDEDRWHLGRKPLEKIAKALVRFGYMDEAEKYLQRAKDAEGDYEVRFVLPEKEPVRDGVISGRVHIDGEVPGGDLMIGVLGYGPCDELEKNFVPDLNSSTAPARLLDVIQAGTDGSFEFGSLGEGAYVLAINTDGSVLSSDKDGFSVDGSPGMICISADNVTVDIGTVEITASKGG
ncbi:MAG: hypothetical protein KAR83_08345 [Thermodesulfovibrionales bacterium]|nr:hypothetical protein [Thermodesulfovibrionales bacterium]